MQNIRVPPTRDDFVKETIKRSQVVAKECGDEYAIVTYDSVVAEIRKTNSDSKFSRVSCLFYTVLQIPAILSLFSSIGKMLERSGAGYIFFQAKIFAGVSINKFLRRKPSLL